MSSSWLINTSTSDAFVIFELLLKKNVLSTKHVKNQEVNKYLQDIKDIIDYYINRMEEFYNNIKLL